jgi:hypothetical protein
VGIDEKDFDSNLHMRVRVSRKERGKRVAYEEIRMKEEAFEPFRPSELTDDELKSLFRLARRDEGVEIKMWRLARTGDQDLVEELRTLI